MTDMRITPPSRPRYDIEKTWPSNVWSIGLDRLDYLGVDEKGQLHWNGQPIEIKRPLNLSSWQRIGAILVTLSAMVAAGAVCVSAYADIAKP